MKGAVFYLKSKQNACDLTPVFINRIKFDES